MKTKMSAEEYSLAKVWLLEAQQRRAEDDMQRASGSVNWRKAAAFQPLEPGVQGIVQSGQDRQP